MIATKEKVNIRPLGPDEVGKAFAVAKKFHKETGLIIDEPDGEYWDATWSGLISSGVGVIIALEAEGKVVGALCGTFSPSLLAPVMMFTEAMWYVEKEWRGHGTRMLRYAEEFAEAVGCTGISMIHLVDKDATRMSNFYRRNGYTPSEVFPVKDLF